PACAYRSRPLDRRDPRSLRARRRRHRNGRRRTRTILLGPRYGVFEYGSSPQRERMPRTQRRISRAVHSRRRHPGLSPILDVGRPGRRWTRSLEEFGRTLARTDSRRSGAVRRFARGIPVSVSDTGKTDRQWVRVDEEVPKWGLVSRPLTTRRERELVVDPAGDDENSGTAEEPL